MTEKSKKHNNKLSAKSNKKKIIEGVKHKNSGKSKNAKILKRKGRKNMTKGFVFAKKKKHVKKAQKPKLENHSLKHKMDYEKEHKKSPKLLKQQCQKHAYVCFPTEKRLFVLYTLMNHIRRYQLKAIIVVNSNLAIDYLEELFPYIDERWTSKFLSKSQTRSERKSIFANFLKEKSGVLFCPVDLLTQFDISSNVWIVQYDPPLNEQKYLNKLKRLNATGGQTLLFLHEQERHFVNFAASKAVHMKPYTPCEKILSIEIKIENLIKENYAIYIKAKQAYTDYVKMYDTLNQNHFKLSQLSLTQIAKSFGFSIPPRVEFGKDAKEKKRKQMEEEKPTKKRTKTDKRYIIVKV